MKRLGMLAAILAIPLLAGVARADELIRPPSSASHYTAVDTTRITTTVKFRPPPLVLPDINARTWKIKQTDRDWLAPQLRKSTQVIGFFSNPKNRWVTAPRKDKCWEVAWSRQCTVARAQLRLHHALAEVAQWRLEHELPVINDWKTAVRFVQKIYPGTESWLLYISDREGGWGPWVWYGGRRWSGYHIGNDFLGADTVGGWMQFRYSTFAPYWRHAQEDLKRRKYVVPYLGDGEYAGWLSPLAQALTAGYMKYYGREGCHWCL